MQKIQLCGVVATLVNFHTNSFETIRSKDNCQCQTDFKNGGLKENGGSEPVGCHLETCCMVTNRFGFIQTKHRNVATYKMENYIIFLCDQGKNKKIFIQIKLILIQSYNFCI